MLRTFCTGLMLATVLWGMGCGEVLGDLQVETEETVEIYFEPYKTDLVGSKYVTMRVVLPSPNHYIGGDNSSELTGLTIEGTEPGHCDDLESLTSELGEYQYCLVIVVSEEALAQLYPIRITFVVENTEPITGVGAFEVLPLENTL